MPYVPTKFTQKNITMANKKIKTLNFYRSICDSFKKRTIKSQYSI